MKYKALIFLLFICFNAAAQSNRKIIKEIKKSQKELNKEFINPETSILDSLDQITFEGLVFYPINTTYRFEAYEDYLFLPYTDLTSGDGSYGGGKYLDLKTPEGNTIIIDFNKAYNPYCAYSHRYSCPVPPEENDLLVRIEAGVRVYEKP